MRVRELRFLRLPGERKRRVGLLVSLLLPDTLHLRQTEIRAAMAETPSSHLPFMHEACMLPRFRTYKIVEGALHTANRALTVSRWDRLLVFGGLNLAALAMFATCFALMPTGVFVLKPRKFAIL